MTSGRLVAFACAVAVAAACTTTNPVDPRAAGTPSGTPRTADAPSASAAVPGSPSGKVRVAYPEEPVTWYPALDGGNAATDLSAIWGLPLFRYDAHGQLRRGLASSYRVDAGAADGPWSVDVGLREGTWSDGQPVTAADVVATFGALRGTSIAPVLEPLTAVEALDERTVRLVFSGAYGRWPHLLAGGLGVLPAHVLADGGLDAYRGAIPVSGGPFRLEDHTPGLRASFVPHPGSALGAPAVERLEVLFTPAYETALGLLDDGRADVVVGHLALNPIERALRIDGVQAAAPLGGTSALLRWSDTDAPALPVRTAARAAIDVSELVQGLLGEAGAELTSTIPGADGPWQRSGSTEVLDGVELDVLVPTGQEVPAFTGRALQRDLRGAGAEVTLVRVDADDLLGPDAREADATLVIRRDAPRPSLVARAGGLPGDALAVLGAADAAVANETPAVSAAQETIHEHALELPLYRVAVAHAWRSELAGLRPSSWPGLAFWDVGAWRWRDAEADPRPGTT